jgi:uncharacterized protein
MMMRSWLSGVVSVAVLLLLRSALAIRVEEVPNPRATNVWVADTVDVIDEAAEARINKMIDAIAAEQGVEIAVVTVESVDSATPKDFATSLFNHWGIGKAGNDNGLLVLLVRGERRLEMETGYGTEAVLTDGWLKSMQQRDMVPAFKAGDYGAGLEAGVSASIERLRQRPEGIPADTGRDSPEGAKRAGTASSPGGGDAWLWFLIAAICGVSGAAVFRWRYQKNRTCPTCKVRMTKLSEEADDEHLDEGQRAEEEVKSVDYQFYCCTQCDFTRLIPVENWFSPYNRCSECGYETCLKTSNVIEPATYSSTGLREIITQCAHCDHHTRRTKTIPRKVQSKSSWSSSTFSSSGFSSSGFSSSSSSSGSFGGGSSGGGGAGSSW